MKFKKAIKKYKTLREKSDMESLIDKIDSIEEGLSGKIEDVDEMILKLQDGKYEATDQIGDEALRKLRIVFSKLSEELNNRLNQLNRLKIELK